MKILGLTGGSGVGKSAACQRLIARGCGYIDADAVYRELCTDCIPMLTILQNVFNDVLFADGSLNRKALGAIVFADPAKLEQLNAITHPYIRAEITQRIARYGREGVELCVLDAPVLFESGFDALCDKTCAILAKRETRIARIMQRDGITQRYAALRIDAQHGDDWYAERCDYLIHNDTDLAALSAQLQSVCDEILTKEVSFS